jgi:anti-sigma-K factor RskA
MTDDDDIDGLAAEYVLGSLDPVERKQVAARRRTDAALSEAIGVWERRLGTLSDGVPGIEPPAHIFASIANRLWGEGGRTIETTETTPLRRSARRWRGLAVGAGALAACLALIAVWLFQNLPSSPTALVAELHRNAVGGTADENLKSTGPPGFVVSLDLTAHTIKVRPVAARPTPRRSYQLWLTQGGAATPSSLGVISQSDSTTSAWRRLGPPGDLVNATLSVSLEPEGGSPTGMPSGPIVFIGKLVPATP